MPCKAHSVIQYKSVLHTEENEETSGLTPNRILPSLCMVKICEVNLQDLFPESRTSELWTLNPFLVPLCLSGLTITKKDKKYPENPACPALPRRSGRSYWGEICNSNNVVHFTGVNFRLTFRPLRPVGPEGRTGACPARPVAPADGTGVKSLRVIYLGSKLSMTFFSHILDTFCHNTTDHL